MNVVGYGGGTNSTAMLIGLWQRRIPVDLILFADPGGEQPHTYSYLEIMSRWLAEHGMPPITRVWYTTRDGQRLTLEQECLRSGSLPSIAYGHKKCSLKHKAFPQEKFCRHDPRCRAVWAGGGRVIKFIGYDAGEPERRERVRERDEADSKYQKEYPLMEWGWSRKDCSGQVHSGHPGGWTPPAGEVLLLLLSQHETAGDPYPLPQISGAVRPCPGHRGQGAA